MKKLLCLIICTIMLVSLASCEISHQIADDHIDSIGSDFTQGEITFGQNVITGALTSAISVKETLGGDWQTVSDTYDLVANVLWEPGYTLARTIKVDNTGVLAFGWKLSFNIIGEFTELADYIDVYVKSGKDVYPENRDDLSRLENYGALSSFTTLGGGSLKAEESDYVTVVFKMREDAPASLQNLDLGAKVSVLLVTTQVLPENDSFNSAYQQ